MDSCCPVRSTNLCEPHPRHSRVLLLSSTPRQAVKGKQQKARQFWFETGDADDASVGCRGGEQVPLACLGGWSRYPIRGGGSARHLCDGPSARPGTCLAAAPGGDWTGDWTAWTNAPWRTSCNAHAALAKPRRVHNLNHPPPLALLLASCPSCRSLRAKTQNDGPVHCRISFLSSSLLSPCFAFLLLRHRSPACPPPLASKKSASPSSISHRPHRPATPRTTTITSSLSRVQRSASTHLIAPQLGPAHSVAPAASQGTCETLREPPSKVSWAFPRRAVPHRSFALRDINVPSLLSSAACDSTPTDYLACLGCLKPSADCISLER